MNDAFTVSLETVFEMLPVGVSVVDPNRRIVLMNDAFRQSLGLPPDTIPSGTLVEDAVRAAALRGVYGPGDPDAQIKAIIAADRTRPGRLRRRTFNGRSHDMYNTPLPDGGYIVTAIETTALLAAQVESEARLSQTAASLSSLRIGLAMFDPQRRLSLVNPRFSALLALPLDRLVPGTSFDAMLGFLESRDEFASPAGSVFIAELAGAMSGKPWSTRYRRADGRSIDITLDPLPGGGCTIAVSDITLQARAEDEANRRAQVLDMVLLHVPLGICVYGPDRRVAMFNDTYNRVMEGAPLRVGEPIADVIRRRAQTGEYGDGDVDALIDEQLGYSLTQAQTRRRVRPNGTAIDVRTAPLPDGGHISVVSDISALVQAEAELRRRAEEMSTMLDNIRHGIMLWGPDGRLVASNRVASDLLDLPADVLVPGRPEAEVLEELSRTGHFGSANGTGPVARLLLSLDRSLPFGREITTRSGRVLDAQSNPAPGGGWISTFTDITKIRETEVELRRAKEAAEAANLAKSRFLATMSHELRTPLNAIIGFSDAMARENSGLAADLVAEYSSQINGAGKQLLALINVILDVARIESGRFEPSGEVFDIGKVLRAAVRQTDSAAQKGEISVTVPSTGDLPKLRGDEHKMIQALSQILSNAIKFTKAGGTVTIETGLTPATEFWVTVTDTGIGIPDRDLERAFEPFTQLDEALSRHFPGAGLGLFMARAIVTAHGGQLTLTSRPGEGTTARMTFPKMRVVEGHAPNGSIAT